MRDVITRLTVASACLFHSTGDKHEKVIVKEKHVAYAVEFYEKMLEKLEIKKHKKIMEEDSQLGRDELSEIMDNIDGREVKILDLLKKGRKSSSKLAEEIGISKRTVKRKYEFLKKHNLIKTSKGKGAELTPKGIKYIKRTTSPDSNLPRHSDIVTKPVTSENKDKKKGNDDEVQD